MVLKIASLYFGLLALGCFAPLPLVKLKEVGIGFYRFFGFSCVALWAVSLMFFHYGQNSAWIFWAPEQWWAIFNLQTFWGLSIVLAFLGTLGFTGALRLRAPRLLWTSYGIAVLSGCAATCLLPWTNVIFPAHCRDHFPYDAGLALWPYRLHALSSSLVMGFATLAMMLGHWYLVTPKLSITPLKRFAGGYILLCLWKAVELTVFFALYGGFFYMVPREGVHPHFHFFPSYIGSLFREEFIFALFRVTWGVVAPLGFCYWIWQTVKMKSTQSATGILYAAMVCTLVGEGIGLFLTLQTGVPF